MIRKLTPKQTAKIEEYYQHWLAVGLNTDRADRPKAESSIEYFYSLINKKKPLFVWLDSPMACLMAISIVAAGSGAQIRSQIYSQIYSQIDSQIYSQIDSQIRSQIDSQIRSQIYSQIDSQIDSEARSARLQHYYPTRYGSAEATWLSYYAYFVEVTGLDGLARKAVEGYQHLKTMAEHCYYWYAFENICFVSEKPTEIYFNENKMLHNESGMSVKFADNWGIYSLSGTLVDEQIVMTSAAELPADLILKSSNSQVRYEIVKKIGIERVMKDLKAETVETGADGVYELLLLDLKDGRKRPFLKMLNPSTFEYHIEGVHPDCKTILQSLNWRNGSRNWSPDGAEWQQQGDVLMFPLGAKSYKPVPRILT